MKERAHGRIIGAIVVGLAAASLMATPARSAELPQKFVHHVYFWLKQPDDAGDRARLIDGLRKLAAVKTIRSHHIGIPAATDREVIDRSYAVSWMLTFDSKADQDAYQVDPIHLRFVDQCSPLWARVVVYDSEAIE
ncbi:Dabb family protein [Rhizorhabdus histidinilytica]|uniref:Dabb family protein n=1 Tax=Rhizorhabdus histidinilytica TaxID=439228 RepID=UPI00321FD79A